MATHDMEVEMEVSMIVEKPKECTYCRKGTMDIFRWFECKEIMNETQRFSFESLNFKVSRGLYRFMVYDERAASQSVENKLYVNNKLCAEPHELTLKQKERKWKKIFKAMILLDPHVEFVNSDQVEKAPLAKEEDQIYVVINSSI